MRQRFAEHFAATVEVDRAGGLLLGDWGEVGQRAGVVGIAGIVAKDDLVGAGEDDPLYARLAAGFKDVLGADDVVLQDALPRRVAAWIGGEVDDGVDIGDGALHGLVVGEVGDAQVFVGDALALRCMVGDLFGAREAVGLIVFGLGGEVRVEQVADQAIGSGDQDAFGSHARSFLVTALGCIHRLHRL